MSCSAFDEGEAFTRSQPPALFRIHVQIGRKECTLDCITDTNICLVRPNLRALRKKIGLNKTNQYNYLQKTLGLQNNVCVGLSCVCKCLNFELISTKICLCQKKDVVVFVN